MKRWRPKKDLDLCVEVSGNIFSKMQNPRLKKCDGYKDQKWTYNKKGDDEISPDMERSVCVTYDTHSPSSGDTIELDHCNGKSEQGWKIVDPSDYDGPSSSGGKGSSSGKGRSSRGKAGSSGGGSSSSGKQGKAGSGGGGSSSGKGKAGSKSRL